MQPHKQEYRVIYHVKAQISLDATIDELLKAGWSEAEIKPLVAAMEDQLRRDPALFGEPLFTIRGTNIAVSVGFIRPFAIEFGIHEATRVVLVRKPTLMGTQRA